MLKFVTLTVLAGALIATSVLPSAAAVLMPKPTTSSSPTAAAGKGESQECYEAMGYMRRVNQGDIAAIHNQHVVLMPVCEDDSLYGRRSYGSLFVNGNVNHLRVPIAQSTQLMAALNAKGYDQHDVVSLRFGGGDSIILYVHQRDMN